jgi:hypothetical protein
MVAKLRIPALKEDNLWHNLELNEGGQYLLEIECSFGEQEVSFIFVR